MTTELHIVSRDVDGDLNPFLDGDTKDVGKHTGYMLVEKTGGVITNVN